MQFDALLRLSDTQALTTTAISNNVYDTGPYSPNANRGFGSGEPMHLTIACRASFTSGGAPTLSVGLESSAAPGLSSPTVHWQSPTFALATLINGFYIAESMPIPPGDYLRFIGLRYTIGVAAYTGGVIDAWLHRGKVFKRALPIVVTSGFGSVPTA